MPIEDRRIIFSNEETYKAIYALCSQKDIPTPPPGQIMGAKEDPRDESNIKFKIGNPLDANHPEEILNYRRDFIAAALMLFCRGLGIPLPKKAKKSVMIQDDLLILRVQI